MLLGEIKFIQIGKIGNFRGSVGAIDFAVKQKLQWRQDAKCG